jgi:hypothetical protein
MYTYFGFDDHKLVTYSPVNNKLSKHFQKKNILLNKIEKHDLPEFYSLYKFKNNPKIFVLK